jgi:glycosyltransferase involved in cell wall biosynthesis
VLAAYGIEAEVLPPPIGIDAGGEQEALPGIEPGFVLTVSRARGYKNSAIVAEAVEQLPGERLVIVGGLPARADGALSTRLTGVSGISDAQLRWLYANCSVLVAVSHEDFGLTPLEANAFGKPVICLRAGGYLDTVRAGETGVYIDRPAVADVAAAIEQVRNVAWSAIAIKAHAERFSPAVFANRLQQIANEVRGLASVGKPANSTSVA